MKTEFEVLAAQVRACTLCAPHLPLGPRPVFQAHPQARILVAAQAPGRKVHETGLPFNDASGERLRAWMGVPREVFYDARRIALLPMGFCYPGRGNGGDLPPRPECAPQWRAPLLAHLQSLRLTVVIGQYALAWHVPAAPGAQRTLADAVKAWPDAQETLFVLAHPSPRNNLWLRRHPWFEQDIVPRLRARVAAVLQQPD